ncbi:MAG: universal stress protein [bacterium]|nr:universal stress protein [bacterium]
MKKILIALDDGPTSEKIASIGFQLGQKLNTEIALLSVVDTTGLITEGGVTPRDLADSIKNDFKKSQQILIDKVFKDYKVWAFVEEGKPYETVLKVAEEWEADLIVLGTHGRTGLSHLLMGSVAEKVIRHSTKPLFIVPSK